MCLSYFVAWVSLFLMFRCPSIFCFCSFACCSMLSMSFFWGLHTVLRAAKLLRWIFLWSALPNFATSDLFKTVSCCPGTLMVRVESVVFTSAASFGMASYKPCSCFLFLWVASVRRSCWRRGLCQVRGCSMVEDASLKVCAISLLLLLASSSFFFLAPRTSASLSRSSSCYFCLVSAPRLLWFCRLNV